MSDLRASLESLYSQCEDETARFFAESIKDAPACYELFKRALEDDETAAFTMIHRTYESRVRAWVVQHSSYNLTQQPVEHFASAAYANFYFTLRGKPLDKFPTIAELLQYLKICVHTAILQELRRAQKHRHNTQLGEGVPAKPDTTDISTDALWRHMCHLVPRPLDQLLMYCAFVEGWKADKIARFYPHHWASAHAVTLELYRIRATLRTDPVLKELANIRETP